MRPPKCRPKKAFQQGPQCIMQIYTAYVVSFFLKRRGSYLAQPLATPVPLVKGCFSATINDCISAKK